MLQKMDNCDLEKLSSSSGVHSTSNRLQSDGGEPRAAGESAADDAGHLKKYTTLQRRSSTQCTSNGEHVMSHVMFISS